MESYTNQADELHHQANKIKHPIDYPPYTSYYETMMEQQQLLSQAKEMKSAARDRCIQADNFVLDFAEKS